MPTLFIHSRYTGIHTQHVHETMPILVKMCMSVCIDTSRNMNTIESQIYRDCAMRYYSLVSFSQGGSLSQLFVSFLETESAPHLSSSLPSGYSRLDPPPTGRVDPRTDPDRPSRATTASLPHHPPHSSSVPLYPPAAPSSLPGPHPSTRPSVLPDSHPIPIHSNIDSQRQSDTGTTPGFHSNSPLPVSKVDTYPTGMFGSLSVLPSPPMLSPIPPTHTTSTSPISSTAIRSSHDSSATATITPSQDKRTSPEQNRHQSYQSSILKNLLS